MNNDRVMLLVSVLLIVVLTGLCSAPAVLSFGASPMGFFLGVLLVALYQPQLLPAWVIALLSLLQDVALGAPYGFHGMIALVAVMLFERRAKSYQRQAPWFVWAILALALALIQLVVCLLAGLFGMQVSIQTAAFAWVSTLPLVVLLQVVCARIFRAGSVA